MHPSPSFRWTDRGEMLAFIAASPFCTIFTGGAVVHTPVTVAAPDRIRFHLGRNNAAVEGMDGGRTLLSCLGPHAYVSPDWYGTADQVPTWNYIAVECEGPIRRLPHSELPSLLDRLGDEQEERLAPKVTWRREKMNPARFEALLGGIAGFELHLESVRGTRKLGQNKSEAERRNVADALDLLGSHAVAAAMRNAR